MADVLRVFSPVNCDQITKEINLNTVITTLCEGVQVDDDDQVTFVFAAVPGAGELTELDTVVIPAHDPVEDSGVPPHLFAQVPHGYASPDTNGGVHGWGVFGALEIQDNGNVDASDADGIRFDQTSAGGKGGGDAHLATTTPVIRLDQLPITIVRFKLDVPDGFRWFLGLSVSVNPTANDNVNDEAAIGMFFSDPAGDTTYQFVGSNGGTAQFIDTGYAPGPNTIYYMRLQTFESGARVVVTLLDMDYIELTRASFEVANLPGATVALYWRHELQETDGTDAVFSTYNASLELLGVA